MKFLFGRTIISRENVQMSALYKTHLDATIHWCNLPAHFWRTNYCALVKQTIWNASLLNRSCWGIQASSSLHTAFVLLLIVLSHICLVSWLKAHQRRGKRLKGTVGDVFCDYIPGLRVKKLSTQNATSVLLHSCSNSCMAGECAQIAWFIIIQLMLARLQSEQQLAKTSVWVCADHTTSWLLLLTFDWFEEDGLIFW